MSGLQFRSRTYGIGTSDYWLKLSSSNLIHWKKLTKKLLTKTFYLQQS